MVEALLHKYNMEYILFYIYVLIEYIQNNYVLYLNVRHLYDNALLYAAPIQNTRQWHPLFYYYIKPHILM